MLKDTALEVLATDDGDPLLAFWPIGLGRTAVFASDVKDRWAARLGHVARLRSVLRGGRPRAGAAAPPPVALELFEGPIRGNARTVSIAVEARAPDGQYRDLLNPVLQVRAADATTPARLTARQVAPGSYEATVVADATQPLTVSVEGAAAGTGITSRTVLPDAAAEYRFRPPDEGLLRSIASSTGGAYHPDAAALANAAGDRRTQRRPLWPSLVSLALLLWFADLVLRRVRVFE